MSNSYIPVGGGQAYAPASLPGTFGDEHLAQACRVINPGYILGPFPKEVFTGGTREFVYVDRINGEWVDRPSWVLEGRRYIRAQTNYYVRLEVVSEATRGRPALRRQ